MTNANDTAMVAREDNRFGEVQKNWGWLLALGILFIVLGTIGLGMTAFLTLASVLFFGVLLLIGGIAQAIEVFKAKGWKSIAWHMFIGLLYLVAGATVITDPLGASIALTLVIGVAILVAGVMRVMMAFQIKGTKGWGWTLASGVISVILGLMILAEWPVSGLWIIGLFVAIEMIVHGWSCVFIALAARSAQKASEDTAAVTA